VLLLCERLWYPALSMFRYVVLVYCCVDLVGSFGGIGFLLFVMLMGWFGVGSRSFSHSKPLLEGEREHRKESFKGLKALFVQCGVKGKGGTVVLKLPLLLGVAFTQKRIWWVTDLVVLVGMVRSVAGLSSFRVKDCGFVFSKRE